MNFRLPRLALILLLVGCTKPPPHPSTSTSDAKPVVVFAAASTTNAIEEINAAFAAAGITTAAPQFAGSAELARQIQAGADAALFLSASKQWADALTSAGLVAERVDLLGNRLVAIVPQSAASAPAAPADLAASSVKILALADPDGVPAGVYARQALEKLGLWSGLESRIVRAGDVRQALAIVERGEADAGIVYATDAAISKKVRVALEIDPTLTDPVVYPLLLLKSHANDSGARRYFEYLRGPDSAAVFARFGFTSPPRSP